MGLWVAKDGFVVGGSIPLGGVEAWMMGDYKDHEISKRALLSIVIKWVDFPLSYPLIPVCRFFFAVARYSKL